MAAQKGSALLLKATPAGGSLTTMAGLRSTSMSINGETVDITNKSSNPLVSGGDDAGRELLLGGGVRSMSITASGVFTDAVVENTMRERAQKGNMATYTLAFGDGDSIAGTFAITSYERAGEFNGEETYSLTMESSGQLTHTVA